MPQPRSFLKPQATKHVQHYLQRLHTLLLGMVMLQGVESRLAIAQAVARQWFGVLIRPRTPADAWLVEGLAGYLHDLFLRRFLGKNELRYRCMPPPHLLCCCCCRANLRCCLLVPL